MKRLAVVFVLCLGFIIYYYLGIFTPPEPVPPIWEPYMAREDPLADSLVACSEGTPVPEGESVSSMIDRAEQVTLVSVLARKGYLHEVMEPRQRFQRPEMLTGFTSQEVVQITRKFMGSPLVKQEFINLGKLLVAAARSDGGSSDDDLLTLTWQVFSDKKTKNRTQVVNDVFPYAQPATMDAFLHRIGVFKEDHSPVAPMIAVLPVSTLDVIVEVLARDSDAYEPRIAELYLGAIRPGNDALDHRSAHMMSRAAQHIQDVSEPEPWRWKVFAQMVDRADDDVLRKFFRFTGFVEEERTGTQEYHPEVLKWMPPELREKVAHKLEDAYVSTLEHAAIKSLRSL